MTFSELVEEARDLMNRPCPSADEIKTLIHSSYGIGPSTTVLISREHIKLLVESCAWALMHPWRITKFREMTHLGP